MEGEITVGEQQTDLRPDDGASTDEGVENEQTDGKHDPPDPFQRCENCGNITLQSHGENGCPSPDALSPTTTGAPTVGQRQALIAADDDDPDATVVFSSCQRTHAYHRLDGESDAPRPACDTTLNNDTSDWITSPRSEQQAAAALHPCLDCHGIDGRAVLDEAATNGGVR